MPAGNPCVNNVDTKEISLGPPIHLSTGHEYCIGLTIDESAWLAKTVFAIRLEVISGSEYEVGKSFSELGDELAAQLTGEQQRDCGAIE